MSTVVARQSVAAAAAGIAAQLAVVRRRIDPATPTYRVLVARA
ncbi:MAG TPA: hypothetical protein VIX84_00160 [Acidimicrobiales bacterium]